MTTSTRIPPTATADDPAGGIQALAHEALTHVAVRHPLLTRFACGDYRDNEAALRQYAIEYSGYATWFPRYLTSVISRLPAPHHRELLMHNLEEEQGKLGPDDCDELRRVGINPTTVQGVPHPQLFRRFCDGVGIERRELAQPTPAAARWRHSFESYLRSATAAQAVGALGLGTELIVRPIYEQLVRGIIGMGSLHRDQFVFFELHCLVDDQHQKDLLEIAADLAQAPNGLSELRSGMRNALRLRNEFWDDLYRNILNNQLANPA